MSEITKMAKAFKKAKAKQKAEEIPGHLEWYEGELRVVVNPAQVGWWRFHRHYDRDGYCDNPARGY